MLFIIPNGILVSGGKSMDNRMNILQKALQLFYEKGYDAIGVQEIADAAGVTKPTLYHYFGSKYGLLEAVVREDYVQLRDGLAVRAEYAGDLPSQERDKYLRRAVVDDVSAATRHGALRQAAP